MLKEKPQLSGSAPSPGPHPLFLLVGFDDGPWQTPSCVSNLKSLASAVAEILKDKPQISGSSPSPGPHPLFLLVGFDDGPWRTPDACQI